MITYALRWLWVGAAIVYVVVAFVMMDLAWPMQTVWEDRAMFLLGSGFVGFICAMIQAHMDDTI